MTKDNQWIKQVEYIIWDLDGTLYKVSSQLSEEIELSVYQLVAEFKEIPLEEAKQLHLQLYDKLHSNTLVLRSIGVDQKLVEEAINNTLIKNIQPNKELVNKMRKLGAFKHIISTNSPQYSAHHKLQLIGFDDSFFETVIGNPDTVGALKPELAPYEYVLNFTQTPANKHLFVGDRYETDLATAKELGMYTALVHAQDERADLEFLEVGDLVDYLSQQSGS